MANLDQHTFSLAQYLPNGKTFEAKNILGSEFNKFLRGLSGELKRSQDLLSLFESEYFPDGTTLYIEEWERAVAIPDSCFSGEGTIQERRRDVVVKLASLGIQTADDFVDIARIFGKDVTITSLAEESFPPYDVPFIPTKLPGSRFTIVVSGVNITTGVPPYDVPFDLFSGETILECLFNNLAPDNCAVIFRNTN